jgi:hypothetical protein
MERLFSPCTRLHDLIESQGLGVHRPDFRELNLDVSTEELLSTERVFTYADLYAMLENRDTVAWLTPHAAVAREYGLATDAWDQLDETCRFVFSADGKEDILALARSPSIYWRFAMLLCDCSQ